MTFFGALVNAGSGAFTYHQIADRLSYVVGLILGDEQMTRQDRPSDVLLDPYDYDFHEDPYPYYKRLRDEAPLYRNEELGFWALSRHQDVLQGFRNSTTLSNRDGVSLDPDLARTARVARPCRSWRWTTPPTCACAPWCPRASRPRRIRELEPRVTELAVQHLDVDAGEGGLGGTVDYVDEFAGKLPMDVISELMGVPVEDRDRIRAMADGVMHREDGVNDVPPAAIEASINLIVYYQEMVAERRKKPTDDLTSALLEAEIDGDRLTDEEVLGFMFLMVIAGNETTTKLLANAAFWGHKNPDQLTPVVRRPGARYRCGSRRRCATTRPARSWRARSSGELTLYDTTIPDGDVLLLLPGSAHRDERVFDNPDDFVIGREIGSKLMSFGSGAHFCLGAHLARMEARVALDRTVQANPRISRSTRPTPSASTPATSADSPTYPSTVEVALMPRFAPLPDRRPAIVAGASAGIGEATAIELAVPRLPGRTRRAPRGEARRPRRQDPRRRRRGRRLPPRRHRSQLGEVVRGQRR